MDKKPLTYHDVILEGVHALEALDEARCSLADALHSLRNPTLFNRQASKAFLELFNAGDLLCKLRERVFEAYAVQAKKDGPTV